MNMFRSSAVHPEPAGTEIDSNAKHGSIISFKLPFISSAAGKHKSVPSNRPSSAETIDPIVASQTALMDAIMTSKVEEIKAWQGSWNFDQLIEGRKTKINPLSLLCRPELPGALKHVSRQEQIELIQHALARGADVWYEVGGNARAVTDTIYQGSVDILEFLLENEYVKAEQLKTYSLNGSNVLHMACYDSRESMIKFLVEEVCIDPDIQCTGNSNMGQTPLFWVLARGPVKISCACYLVSKGADPFKTVFLADKYGNKNGCVISPFSMAIRTFPNFAENCLDTRRIVKSNRGLAQTVSYDYQGLLVDKKVRTEMDPEDGKLPEGGLIMPAFAMQNDYHGDSEDSSQLCSRFCCFWRPFDVLLRKKIEAQWETFDYDRDPQNMMTVVEMMIKFRSKILLRHMLMRKAMQAIWDLHCKTFYYFQLYLFVVYWSCCIMATIYWPKRIHWEEDPTQTTPVICKVCLSVTIPIAAFFMWVEAQELTARSLCHGIKNYVQSGWNYIDWLMNFLVCFLLGLMWRIDFAEQEHRVVVARTVDSGIVLLSLSLASKAMQFATVHPLTGPMVGMIFRMATDILTWLIVFLLIWIGFSQGFYTLLKNIPCDYPGIEADACHNVYPYSPYLLTFLWIFGDNLSSFPVYINALVYYEENAAGYALFVGWLSMCSIMLLNMLIAMMGDTYERVHHDTEGEHVLRWTERVMELWVTCPKTKHDSFLRELWLISGNNIDEFGPPDSEEDDNSMVAARLARLETAVEALTETLKDSQSQVVWLENQLARTCAENEEGANRWSRTPMHTRKAARTARWGPNRDMFHNTGTSLKLNDPPQGKLIQTPKLNIEPDFEKVGSFATAPDAAKAVTPAEGGDFPPTLFSHGSINELNIKSQKTADPKLGGSYRFNAPITEEPDPKPDFPPGVSSVDLHAANMCDDEHA